MIEAIRRCNSWSGPRIGYHNLWLGCVHAGVSHNLEESIAIRKAHCHDRFISCSVCLSEDDWKEDNRNQIVRYLLRSRFNHIRFANFLLTYGLNNNWYSLLINYVCLTCILIMIFAISGSLNGVLTDKAVHSSHDRTQVHGRSIWSSPNQIIPEEGVDDQSEQLIRDLLEMQTKSSRNDE